MMFDQFIGKVISFLSLPTILIFILNKYISDFAAKQENISKIFKRHEINHIMMKKIRIILEDFNEVDYKENPNFNMELKPSKLYI